MGYLGIIMKLKLKFYHDISFKTYRMCLENLFSGKNAHNFNINKNVHSACDLKLKSCVFF